MWSLLQLSLLPLSLLSLLPDGARAASSSSSSSFVVTGSFDGAGSSLSGVGRVVAHWAFAGSEANSDAPWLRLGAAGLGGTGANDYGRAAAMLGGDLYVGGALTTVADLRRWDGDAWTSITVNNVVRALAVVPAGSATDLDLDADVLAVAGDFTSAGSVSPANRVALWNGTVFSALGAGVGASAYALAVFNGRLHAAGTFTTVNGGSNTGASRIARWNAAQALWEPLAQGVVSTNGRVEALLARSNKELVVAGEFTSVGASTPATRVAVWNGAAWAGVDAGGSGPNGVVYCLAEYRGDVVVGGQFSTAGSVAVGNIARLVPGAATPWSSLGGGTDGAVRALAVLDGELLVGGDFSGVFGRAGGSDYASVRRLARWDGSEWFSVGSGVTSSVYGLMVPPPEYATPPLRAVQSFPAAALGCAAATGSAPVAIEVARVVGAGCTPEACTAATAAFSQTTCPGNLKKAMAPATWYQADTLYRDAACAGDEFGAAFTVADRCFAGTAGGGGGADTYFIATCTAGGQEADAYSIVSCTDSACSEGCTVVAFGATGTCVALPDGTYHRVDCRRGPLSAGEIAGIVLGSLAAVGLAAAVGFVLWRGRQAKIGPGAAGVTVAAINSESEAGATAPLLGSTGGGGGYYSGWATKT